MLVFKGVMGPPRNTAKSYLGYYGIKLMLDYVKELVPRVQQVKRVVTILAGVIDPTTRQRKGSS